MDNLLILALLLGLITVVGHLIWLAIAAGVRLLFPGRRPERAEPIRERQADTHLRELEITTRTIHDLSSRGLLDRAAAERVEQCLEARRRSLQRKDIDSAAKARPLAPAASVAELEELLGGGLHPRDLTPSRRQEALACYRRLNNNQRAALNAPTLLALARLLVLAGMTSHAVNTYRRLLDDHPDLADRAEVALEAGRLAFREDLTELARRFLQMALHGVLLEPDYVEARTMLGQLDESVQAPIALAVVERGETPQAIPMPSAEAVVRPAPDAPPVVAPPPRRPRRALTTLLAAFMEDRNILWGELAGGMLIVGCSIALVITLWHSLEELPYFPFLIFASITAALFGAGEYTLHHWKLEATSRGLLVIALLLVPLNLLVLADPSLSHANSALEVTFKAAAVLLSLGMIRLAGRDLIGVGVLPGPIDRRWLFMLAIVGAAGSQLIVPRLLDEPHPILFIVLGCVPLACHLLACGAVVAGLARARARAENQCLEIRQAHALFVFLGLASFALFVALGFLLSRSGDLAHALPRLAVPFALAGVPILAGGLLVRRSLPGEDGGAPRTAGTAVAFTGLTVMLSAVVLAWPQPWAVLLVCLGNAAILSAIAFRWRLPSAHVVALPCLALAVLIVVQFALGTLAVPPETDPAWWLARQLLSPSSGVALAIVMALLAADAEGLARSGQRVHAASYALGCAALGVLALLTTAWHGVEAPWPAAVVDALAALCALALYVRWRRPALPYTGLGLLVAASLWGLWAVAADNRALWGFIVALESAALAIAATRSHPLRRACRDVAATTIVLGLVLALVTPGFPTQRLHTGTAAVLALAAFLLAHVVRRPTLVWLGSTFLFAALAHLFIWDLGASGPPQPLLMALLAHATFALLGVLAFQVRSFRGALMLRAPLSDSAQLTSSLAVPLLLLPKVTPMVHAGYTLWLAVLWLVVAGVQRSPAWFTAFQAALCTAVVFAVTAFLPEQQDWFDPRSLQAYGVGLGLLGLGWIAARAGLSSRPRMRELWQTPWPSLDRVVLGGLIVAQLALTLWGISPGVNGELIPSGTVSAITWPATAAHGYGAGAWVLLGVLAIVLLAALREQGRASILVGLLVLAFTVPVLAAGPFAAEQATASALRWGLALVYLACSALVWLRRGLGRVASSAGVTFAADSSALLWTHGLLGVVAVGVLLLTAQVAVLGFAGLRPTGPAPGSLFAEMGWVLSNVTPLVLLTVGLLGHAVRERSPGYAFTAGLVANLSLTGGYALAVVTGGRHLDTAEIVVILQLGSLMAALWALAWMLIRHASAGGALAWLGERRRPAERRPEPFLAVQAALGCVIHTVLLLWPLVEVWGSPGTKPEPFFAAIGSPAGWLALLLSGAAAFWYLAVNRPRARIHVLGIVGLSVGVLAACTASPWDTGNWRTFHVLELFWSMLGLAATVAGVVTFSLRVAGLNSADGSEPHARRFTALFRPYELRRWLEGIGLAILVLALRGDWSDPWRPTSSAASVLVVSLMAAALAIWSGRQRYVWISGLLLDLLGILYWSAWGPSTGVSFLLTNALCLAVAAVFWSSVDLALSEPLRREDNAALPLARLPAISFAHCAANVGLGLVVLVVVLLLAADLQPPGIAVSGALAWTALAAVGAALIVALWDRRAWFASPGLYLLGLAAVGLTLHGLGRSPAGLGWSAALTLAGYTVLASMICHIFTRSQKHWFIPAQAAVAGVVIALSLWMCLDFAALVDRLAGPAAVLLLIPAAGLLIGRDAVTQWLRPAVLVFGALAAAEIAWAIPEPGGTAPWLHRNVLLMVALAAMTALLGIALPRWRASDPEWVRWGRRLGPALGVLAALTLLVLLVQEFRLYDAATRRTPMARPEVLIVLAAFVTLMVSGILFAVAPGRDPFGLSQRGRTLYVYAVELLLVLLFVHIRLNVPELFRGWAGKYWTIILMLIAYLGVGLSEFFERRKLAVLAAPLQRTGVFLPLVPLLAFWAKPPAPLLNFADAHAPGLRPMLGYLDKLPQHFDSYAFLWLLAAGLFGLVFLTRRSFRFALVAALAANCALWSLLTHHGVTFLLHPQCWLIPLALIVLAAEHVNRDRLRLELSAGLRYLGISMIYVSSTADLFIAGLGNSIVLPIFLAVLSLAGILVGILFRVRAFLFLGISFLFLDVFTMIWYAAVDRYQTWVWWVSGILLGAAILTLFAVFEKRRNDVLHLLEDLKHWD